VPIPEAFALTVEGVRKCFNWALITKFVYVISCYLGYFLFFGLCLGLAYFSKLFCIKSGTFSCSAPILGLRDLVKIFGLPSYKYGPLSTVGVI
jgi:hypothetical protein